MKFFCLACSSPLNTPNHFNDWAVSTEQTVLRYRLKTFHSLIFIAGSIFKSRIQAPTVDNKMNFFKGCKPVGIKLS